MAADGFLNFDTKINTSGFQRDTKNIANALNGMKDKLRKLGAMLTSVFSARALANFAKEAKEAWNTQSEAETKLETILGRNVGASEEQIKAVKEWASELQKVGVIGDEIQLSGLQELSTYIESADSLKTMNVVLNDMLAQQYGLNATAEEAVTISTMLGKVLNGQVSALSRYGYSFNAAQEQLLKYGTEEQRVATLAEVVEASVGGMNEALANTPAGRLKQVSNTLGDIKEQFGKAFTNIQALFVPALEEMATLLEHIADLAIKASESLAGLFGIELKDVKGVGSYISESVDYQDDLTESVEETAENQKESLEIEKNSLANFDKINTVTTKTANETEPEKETEKTAGTESVKIAPKVTDSDVKKAADKLSDKLAKLIKPIQLAWEDKSPELLENFQNAAENIKGLFKSVGNSVEEVWTNGSGERLISNSITLLSDALGIIGDISLAMKNAWEDEGRGTAFIQSIVDRWNSLLEMIHAVSYAFRIAWNDGTGEKICGKILEIFTNINKVWTNLRTQFTEAWNQNNRGVKIFKGILSITDTILGVAKRITSSTAEWAKNIDFSPVLYSIDGLLVAIDPLIENIGDALAWCYENVLLPLGKWTIEKAVPATIDLLSAAIKVLNKGLTAAKPVFQFVTEKFLKPIAEWTGGMIIEILRDLTIVLEGIADGSLWEEIRDNLWIFYDSVVNTTHNIIDSVSSFFENIKNVFIGVYEFLSDIWNSTKETFSAVGEWFGEQFTTARDNIQTAWSSVVNWFTDIWVNIEKAFSVVADWFREQFKKAWNNISNAWSNVVKWFTDIWESIKKVFSITADWFREQFRKAWDNISNAWSNAVKWFTDVWENIKKVFSVVADWFKQQFTNAWDNIRNAWNNAVQWFSGVWDGITNVFAAVGDWFREKFESAWNNIAEIFNRVRGFFNDRLNDIYDIFGNIGNWFEEKFSNAWERVKNVFSGVRDFFNNVWSNVSDGARDGINWVIGKLNDLLWRLENGLNGIVDSLNSALSIHIPDDVPVIGGTSFEMGLSHVSIPRIPELAQGTYVPANYGNFLAVLGDNKREPEIVSPESKMKSAFREVINEQGRNDKPITVICMLDGREIGRVAVNAVNRDNALKGR